jgi:hypothetical protein
MVVLVVCLVASMAIAIVRLATTPTEILGAGFRGLPAERAAAYAAAHPAQASPRSAVP